MKKIAILITFLGLFSSNALALSEPDTCENIANEIKILYEELRELEKDEIAKKLEIEVLTQRLENNNINYEDNVPRRKFITSNENENSICSKYIKKDFCEIYPKASPCLSSKDKEVKKGINKKNSCEECPSQYLKSDELTKKINYLKEYNKSLEIVIENLSEKLNFALSEPLTTSEFEIFMNQIKTCWISPAGVNFKKDDYVKIRATILPNRMVRENSIRIIDTNVSRSNPAYGPITESALRTFLHPNCQILKLPENKYAQWKTITLNFTFSNMIESKGEDKSDSNNQQEDETTDSNKQSDSLGTLILSEEDVKNIKEKDKNINDDIFVEINKTIDTSAEQAIVIDFDTNEILFQKNADQRIDPASMTKFMTAYVTFDFIKNYLPGVNISEVMDTKCKVSDKSYKMGGSRMFLELNDIVSVEDLIKGMIVQSGNDATIALSECLFGSEDFVVNLMNVELESGSGYVNRFKNPLKGTNFTNVTGWPDENHYSTVHDLAILSNALIKAFPSLYEYFKIKEFTYNDIKQPNRNKLLSSVEGLDGLKTGYTKKSGWSIAASALREGRRITVVLSGTNSSKSRFEETSKLLDWAFTHTFQKKSQTKKKDFCEIYPKASSCISSIDTEDTPKEVLEETPKPVF